MKRTILLILGLLLPLSVAQGMSDYDQLEALRESALTVRSSPIEVGGIPRGAQRVRLLRLHMSASCGKDIHIWGISVRKIGLGDVKHIRGIYLLQGNKRMTRPVQFSSEESVEINTLGFTIPACRTVVVDVAVDFSLETPIGSAYYLRIDEPEDFRTSTETIEARFPLVNAQRVDVTPVDVGTVSATFLDVGSVQSVVLDTLAKFRLKADGSVNQLISSITLTNDGTAHDDDLRNLYLTRSGRPLTSIVKLMDDDSVTLEFTSPYLLRKGSSVLFKLMGNAYTSQRTLQFTIKEPSDINAVPSALRGRKFY